MDIVERLRSVYGWSIEAEWCAEAADEIERLRNAITVQANAVRVLHEAETSELNHLRKNAQEAYTAKATLDSEREANKILTDENERLREVLLTVLEACKDEIGSRFLTVQTKRFVKKLQERLVKH